MCICLAGQVCARALLPAIRHAASKPMTRRNAVMSQLKLGCRRKLGGGLGLSGLKTVPSLKSCMAWPALCPQDAVLNAVYKCKPWTYHVASC